MPSFNFRIVILLFSLAIATSGCNEFTSERKLDFAAAEVPIGDLNSHAGFFENSRHEDSDEHPFPALVQLEVGKDAVSAKWLIFECEKAGDQCFRKTEYLSSKRIYKDVVTSQSSWDYLAGSARWPEGWYLGWDGTDSGAQYQIFRFDGDFVYAVKGSGGMDISGDYKVSSIEDLARKVNFQIAEGNVHSFKMLSRDEAARKISQVNSVDRTTSKSSPPRSLTRAEIRAGKVWMDPSAVAAPAQPSTARATAPSTSYATLEHGDSVYIQGWLSDEPVYVIGVDEPNARVKVLRRSDGETYWVARSSIISSGQSTVNGLARGAVAIGVIACIFNPDACKQKDK